eukprot:1155470-Pelagomonas_calceolata.AAC.4
MKLVCQLLKLLKIPSRIRVIITVANQPCLSAPVGQEPQDEARAAAAQDPLAHQGHHFRDTHPKQPG